MMERSLFFPQSFKLSILPLLCQQH